MTDTPHWMPFNPTDYMRDTAHLTTIEHGAYVLLILFYWQHGGLPDDDAQLARIVRLPLPTWRKVRKVIAPLFHGNGGPWRHKRIDQELAKAADMIARRKQAASKAGTVSAMMRERNRQAANVTSTSRARDVHDTRTESSTSRAHNNNSKITTTTDDAARARATPAPNTTTEAAEAPAGLAEEPAAAPTKSMGSPALAAAMQRKGWVR